MRAQVLPGMWLIQQELQNISTHVGGRNNRAGPGPRLQTGPGRPGQPPPGILYIFFFVGQLKKAQTNFLVHESMKHTRLSRRRQVPPTVRGSPAQAVDPKREQNNGTALATETAAERRGVWH